MFSKLYFQASEPALLSLPFNFAFSSSLSFFGDLIPIEPQVTQA